jgi:hypothetical protein
MNDYDVSRDDLQDDLLKAISQVLVQLPDGWSVVEESVRLMRELHRISGPSQLYVIPGGKP